MQNLHLLSLNDLPPDGKRLTVDDVSLWAANLREFHMDCRVEQPLKVELHILPVEDGRRQQVGHGLGQGRAAGADRAHTVRGAERLTPEGPKRGRHAKHAAVAGVPAPVGAQVAPGAAQALLGKLCKTGHAGSFPVLRRECLALLTQHSRKSLRAPVFPDAFPYP